MLKHRVISNPKMAYFVVIIMTSSNGNIVRVTGFCAGNSPVTGKFPAQRPVTRSLNFFFDLRLE